MGYSNKFNNSLEKFLKVIENLRVQVYIINTAFAGKRTMENIDHNKMENLIE